MPLDFNILHGAIFVLVGRSDMLTTRTFLITSSSSVLSFLGFIRLAFAGIVYRHTLTLRITLFDAFVYIRFALPYLGGHVRIASFEGLGFKSRRSPFFYYFLLFFL